METNNVKKEAVVIRAHICDLPKTSGSHLPRLAPTARFYSRWKRNFQKLVLVSAIHPLTRFILRSQAAISFEKQKHSRSSSRWIIHPYSLLRFYWDILMTFIFLYFFLSFPHILSFYRVRLSSGPEVWKIVYPAYIICIMDIFLNFVTGFISPDGYEIFIDFRLVIRNYLKGFFFIDLISSVPYTWFYAATITPSGPNSNCALLILECLPILKVIRMATVRRNIRMINMYFNLTQLQRMIIWLTVLTLLMIHWSACASHIYPFIVLHIRGEVVEGSDIYYVKEKIGDKSNLKIYIIYFYVGISNLNNINTIEFESFGMSDKTIRSIILLVGRGYLCYLIVATMKLCESLSEPVVKYKKIVYQIEEYIRQKKFSPHLKNKLILYYEYRYQHYYFKEHVIRETLSSYLTQEIVIHSSRGLLDTAILHILPRHVLSDLINAFKHVIYLEKDVIYKVGCESDCMYFIINGIVVLITFSGKEVCHLHDGDHFGEIGLIYPDLRRTESVIALEICELFILHRRDFKYLFTSESQFYINLKNIADERLKTIKKLEKENLD